MRSSIRRPPAARPRSFWGAVLALVVLLGAIDIHPMGERHSLFESAGRSEYSPEAVHTGQPLHLEPGSVVSRPPCPVCLQRLQLGGLHLEATAGLAPPDPHSRLAPAGKVVVAVSFFAPSAARGPPSLS